VTRKKFPPPDTVPPPGWDMRSETPRTDAFIEQMPFVPMNDPMTTAAAVRELIIAWSGFARELERECARKVWPH
jgi:hypothetical protein